MAFLEWRRAPLFDLHNQVDEGKIAECLLDTTVSAATSGNNHVVLCDVTGWVHILSRSWSVVTSFKAYELTVTLAQQFQHDPYLVTIGDDEPGITPLLKVWDWSRLDRHGMATLLFNCRVVPSHMQPTPATVLALHENKNLLAIGFQDGSVSLLRGDVTRKRSGKLKTITEAGSSPVTGLAFKGAEQLFVVTRANVCVYWLTSERCVTLDAMGAPPHCSVLTDKHQLMMARRDAIYCYTSEVRGPCYAFEGEKVRLNWFRSYLIITTAEIVSKPNPSTSKSETKSHHITILDIQNKFIVFSKTFEEIDAILTECGSLYVLTKSKNMLYLNEKDLQSKLSLLFKKSLYDVAIRMVSSQHYDADGLCEIYKQYGDHLYAKGDLKGAIDQYIKTIGRLETSYVIRKYLESRHLEPLVLYLEQLHKKGYATEDHTTLLLTCFVKLDQHDQKGNLKEFINSKNNVIEFDVDVAIKVIRQVSPDDALLLAENHKRHDAYLKITIEDKKDYKRALDYISDLEFDDADMYTKKYGNILIQHVPKESTDFLKILCTDYRPRNKPLVEEMTLSGALRSEPDRALPDDYIHLFLSNSEQLIEFLEHMVESDQSSSKLVYNALIEHYIHVWAKFEDESEKSQYEQKVMAILKNPEANYDKDQTLIICQMLDFKAGMLHLYEENKLWRSQVSVYMRDGQWPEALAVCRRRGVQCPRLWLDVLWWPPPADCLPELLSVIANEKLLSPILVVDCLASTNNYTLGDVRNYLMKILKGEEEVINREQELATKYRGETERMKAQIKKIQDEPLTFQSSRCAACNRSLEQPTVHFFCQHSYHQHCFKSYSEHESECPACSESSPRHDSPAPRAAEALHSRLHNELDPYAVVSEYFGRGLFNKLTVITDGDPSTTSGDPPVHPAPLVLPPAPTYGPGAEARMRMEEGQSKLYAPNTSKPIPKGTVLVPVPEGLMRVRESARLSSSVDSSKSRIPEPMDCSPQLSPKTIKKLNEHPPKPAISAGMVNDSPCKRLFVQEYDESKNPFYVKDNAGSTDSPGNPFSEDDDYDSALNPFS